MFIWGPDYCFKTDLKNCDPVFQAQSYFVVAIYFYFLLSTFFSSTTCNRKEKKRKEKKRAVRLPEKYLLT